MARVVLWMACLSLWSMAAVSAPTPAATNDPYESSVSQGIQHLPTKISGPPVTLTCGGGADGHVYIYVNGQLRKKCFEAGSEEQTCTVKGLNNGDKLEVKYGDGCSWRQTYTGESSDHVQLSVTKDRLTGYQYSYSYEKRGWEIHICITIVIRF